MGEWYTNPEQFRGDVSPAAAIFLFLFFLLVVVPIARYLDSTKH